MIVTPQPEAVEAGRSMLEAGGSGRRIVMVAEWPERIQPQAPRRLMLIRSSDSAMTTE